VSASHPRGGGWGCLENRDGNALTPQSSFPPRFDCGSRLWVGAPGGTPTRENPNTLSMTPAAMCGTNGRPRCAEAV
jgi:hypothetical protein